MMCCTTRSRDTRDDTLAYRSGGEGVDFNNVFALQSGYSLACLAASNDIQRKDSLPVPIRPVQERAPVKVKTPVQPREIQRQIVQTPIKHETPSPSQAAPSVRSSWTYISRCRSSYSEKWPEEEEEEDDDRSLLSALVRCIKVNAHPPPVLGVGGARERGARGAEGLLGRELVVLAEVGCVAAVFGVDGAREGRTGDEALGFDAGRGVFGREVEALPVAAVQRADGRGRGGDGGDGGGR